MLRSKSICDILKKNDVMYRSYIYTKRMIIYILDVLDMESEVVENFFIQTNLKKKFYIRV